MASKGGVKQQNRGLGIGMNIVTMVGGGYRPMHLRGCTRVWGWRIEPIMLIKQQDAYRRSVFVMATSGMCGDTTPRFESVLTMSLMTE